MTDKSWSFKLISSDIGEWLGRIVTENHETGIIQQNKNFVSSRGFSKGISLCAQETCSTEAFLSSYLIWEAQRVPVLPKPPRSSMSSASTSRNVTLGMRSMMRN